MRYADPEAQADIDRLRAENRTLRRGSRTLGEIITATNRDLAELVGWEIDEDQDCVEWAAAWDQLREMRAELVRLRAKIARVEDFVSVHSGTWEGFTGCTDRNPDVCACSTDADVECAVCGNEIEPGQAYIAAWVMGNPHLPVDHRDNWCDPSHAHAACSALRDPEESA